MRAPRLHRMSAVWWCGAALVHKSRQGFMLLIQRAGQYGGIWTGTDDIIERLNAVFATLPPHVIARMAPTSGQHLFLRVMPDRNFSGSV
jgi:hypothetical protein